MHRRTEWSKKGEIAGLERNAHAPPASDPSSAVVESTNRRPQSLRSHTVRATRASSGASSRRFRLPAGGVAQEVLATTARDRAYSRAISRYGFRRRTLISKKFCGMRSRARSGRVPCWCRRRRNRSRRVYVVGTPARIRLCVSAGPHRHRRPPVRHLAFAAVMRPSLVDPVLECSSVLRMLVIGQGSCLLIVTRS